MPTLEARRQIGLPILADLADLAGLPSADELMRFVETSFGGNDKKILSEWVDDEESFLKWAAEFNRLMALRRKTFRPFLAVVRQSPDGPDGEPGQHITQVRPVGMTILAAMRGLVKTDSVLTMVDPRWKPTPRSERIAAAMAEAYRFLSEVWTLSALRMQLAAEVRRILHVAGVARGWPELRAPDLAALLSAGGQTGLHVPLN